MEARRIDPRDMERDENNPAYRVYFWKRPTYPRVPAESVGYDSDEYELTGAPDVREVVAWAEENAGPDRTFTVYAVVDRCLIRLLGEDPTRAQ